MGRGEGGQEGKRLTCIWEREDETAGCIAYWGKVGVARGWLKQSMTTMGWVRAYWARWVQMLQ